METGCYDLFEGTDRNLLGNFAEVPENHAMLDGKRGHPFRKL
jgi:hypothetical protein